MNKKTAVYMRVSTEEQSLASQKLELEKACEIRGWNNLEFYTEKMSSVKHRVELERMLAEVRSGRVGRIVCYKLDRIGRSLAHLAIIVDELSKLKVPLVCTSQGIDTSDDNPVGRLQLGVLMAVAEFERGIIRERTIAGQAAARAAGVRFGRKPIPEDRQAKVRAMRSSGHTMRAIAASLAMPVSTVHKILAA